MKKFLIHLSALLISANSFSQIWTYNKGETPFDGTYKTSSVEGIGYEFPYKEPLFVINIFRGEISDPNIYITRVPYAGCANNQILIKFDNDDKIYRPTVSASKDNEQWFMDFYSGYITIKDSIKKIIKYYVVSKNQTILLREHPNPYSPVLFQASNPDTISLLLFDGSYWTCKYHNKILYVNNAQITNINNAFSSSEELYVPIGIDKELNEFIKDIKSHSKMNIRLMSDCVKADFEFSLKGSSAAMNFVFSK